MHMIWFDRATYVFRVIVISPVGSHPLTYIVATKHASGRLHRAPQVGDMHKNKMKGGSVAPRRASNLGSVAYSEL